MVGGPDEIEVSLLPSEFILYIFAQELNTHVEDIVPDTEITIWIAPHPPFSLPDDKGVVLTDGSLAFRD